jgi:putative two-component system response regulator
LLPITGPIRSTDWAGNAAEVLAAFALNELAGTKDVQSDIRFEKRRRQAAQCALLFPDDQGMSSTSPATAPAARPVVLLVDDTPENLSVLGELLQPFYRVRVANSGARALSVVASEPRPDLILLDVMMQDMDGYEVIHRLRADPATRDIPVIFVTALDATEDERKGLELGAADYITKPVRPAIMHARVRAQLELKQARDRMRDQNAWLESQVLLRRDENQRLQDVSLRALASLASTRDNETGNHILRTQGYVRVLCEHLAARGRHSETLTPDGIRFITMAAPLHDIGKVGIPDSILLKPGKLDHDEWEVMRTHAELGAEAIQRAMDQDGGDARPFGFLLAAIEIALGHHEKWDGSGYPHGLKGEAIPLPARLMAVADVFDALISRRVYKPPFPLEEAASMIADGRGTHFDPELVDAFLEHREEFFAIARRHVDHED